MEGEGVEEAWGEGYTKTPCSLDSERTGHGTYKLDT